MSDQGHKKGNVVITGLWATVIWREHRKFKHLN